MAVISILKVFQYTTCENDHDDHLGHEHFDHDDHIKHDDNLDPPQPYRSVWPKNITYEHFQKIS